MKAEALIVGVVVAAIGVGLSSRTRRASVLVTGAISVIAARTIYVMTDYVLWQRRESSRPAGMKTLPVTSA